LVASPFAKEDPLASAYWDAFRSLLDQMAHEDDLMLGRTLWLVLSQCLLLIASVVIDREIATAQFQRASRYVGALGIVTTAFIYAAILASEFDFVQLRTQLRALAADHPDLPMRPLPAFGIGAGLLCPIALCVVVLFCWVWLASRSRWAAWFALISSTLFALFVVGEAHPTTSGGPVAVAIGASGAAAAATLGLALVYGVRSVRRPVR
jgi:hypothetical protein